jgi:uncharacterized membrane protein
MTRNESTPDRLLRAVLGTALVAIGVWGLDASLFGIVVAAFGGILLFTAATGFCLLYKVLGVKTCKAR